MADWVVPLIVMIVAPLAAWVTARYTLSKGMRDANEEVARANSTLKDATSIGLLRSQLRSLELTLDRTRDERDKSEEALRVEIRELRNEIRQLRQALVAAGIDPQSIRRGMYDKEITE